MSELRYTPAERERLRELARRVAEIAADPQQEIHRGLWRSVNDLQMTRPVLHVRDYPLELIELNQALTPTIEQPFLREIEQDLLVKLYEWEHLRVNRVIEPYLKCPCVIEDSGFGEITVYNAIQDGGIDQTGDHRTAQGFEAVIKSLDQLELIKEPRVAYDEAATTERFELMQDIFSDIIEVRLHGRSYFRAAPWDDIMTWVGINEGMMMFYDNPELMHALIRRLTDYLISWVKQYERLGLLSSNNAFENVLNNDPGYTSQLPEPPASGIGARLQDIWGGMSDQIMTAASPAMSEEFGYVYEQEYARLFGLFGYGCCERLDHKYPLLQQYFPNLRKVSVSPFSNLEAMLEQIGPDVVACFKPNSIYLSGPDSSWADNQAYLTRELKNVLSLAKKYRTNLVINMKTLINLGGNPRRLWWWCRMAQEVIDSEW